MDFIRNYIVITLLLLSLYGCGISKRKVSNNKNNKKTESLVVTKKQSRGEVIVLTPPKTPAKRFIDTVIVYKGDSGATVVTRYDNKGYVDNQVFKCPDIVETTYKEEKTTEKTKTKESKREMDQKILILIPLIVIILGVIFLIYKKKPI